MSLPSVAISLGDPAGIGPEIVAKALSGELPARCVVYGDARLVEKAASMAGLSLKIHGISRVQEAAWAPGTVEVVDLANAPFSSFEPGKVQALCGRAAWECVEAAAAAAMKGEVDALDTAPINKEAIRAAQLPFIGHTEMLESISASPDPLTMFETLGLRVFFLSRHVSLRRACELVTAERILDYIGRCIDALGRLGVRGGELAVAGLNPHCGEHGLFGDEEARAIEPAVRIARERGYRVVGPIGPDSVFHQAKQGRYAAVLSLYHDQGHIATKTLDFDRTISLTLGLPFLRTSVDHGTAFDIAWKGLASPISMEESIKVAARYALAYKASAGPKA